MGSDSPRPSGSSGRSLGRAFRFPFEAPFGLALLLVLVSVTLSGQAAHGQEPTAALEPGNYGPIGTIAAPHGAGVILTNVATGDEQLLAVLPPLGVSGHAAWSPDRTRLAISRFERQPGERVGGSDILVLPAAGGEAIPVAAHDQDGALLGAPAWLPDSSGLYYDHLPPSGGASTAQVMFAPIDPNQRVRAIATGGWPAVSPDGRYLAYVKPSQTWGFLNELVMLDTVEGLTRTLVPADQLIQITSPRFSPDGSEIAFVGSTSVGEAMESSRPGDLTQLFLKGGKAGPRRPESVRGVMAHGPPGDIWVMSVAGGTSTRLTAFEEDEPTLAWSPDGYWLAMMGGDGLYLMPRDRSQLPYKLTKGGFGGIDWR